MISGISDRLKIFAVLTENEGIAIPTLSSRQLCVSPEGGATLIIQLVI